MKYNSEYKEIFKLIHLLRINGIEYDFYDLSGSNVYGFGKDFIQFQIIINKKHLDDRAFSIIEGTGTYGSQNDKLELMNYFENKEVTGYLTAEEVLEIIKKYSQRINLKSDQYV